VRFQVVRYECIDRSGKTFRQRRPDGAGRWLWNLDGVTPVLYRLPQLLESGSAAPVFIVEGEKDADRLIGNGFVATTNPMGAKKWQDSFNKALIGRHVVILADNDDVGETHAQMVAESLSSVAASVKVVHLDGLAEHGDVSDWLDVGHTPDELQIVVAQTPLWEPIPVAGNASQANVKSKWPVLRDAALYGLAGDIVHAIEPHTEADRAALLINTLVCFGSAAGHTAHALAEGHRHTLNLFAVVVGDTAKGRKGSSLGRVKQLFDMVDPQWRKEKIVSGLSSGEGCIYSVRDGVDKHGKEDQANDGGIDDKRLLVIEEEFANVLKMMTRQGNTLSTTIREAWDSGDLRVMTRNNPIAATDAHISIIGHITSDELRRYLTKTEEGNGFANRFLWVCSKRSKVLPDGGGTPEFGDAVEHLHKALSFARNHSAPISRDDAARALWHDVYEPLSEGKAGLMGAVTGRAEAQVLRLSTLYAVMDCSTVVRKEHLEAALALWEYTEASAAYIFGETASHSDKGTRNADADRVITALEEAGDQGLDLTGIHKLFNNHKPSRQQEELLAQLEKAGRVMVRREATDGRNRSVYVAV
jgi:5S rRNA maturation endonuclease (ribonuclease M5)